MRAKTINEVQNFERGKNPRSSLGIGGVQFGVEKYKMKEKLKKDWADFVKKTLMGKTITGTFNKLKGDIIERNWGEYTVKVKVISNLDIDDMGIVVSDENNRYIIPGDGKIFIE